MALKLENIDIAWACRHRLLFGPWFKNPKSWIAWMAFLKHVFGLRCTPNELKIIMERTGRLPMERRHYDDIWLVVGRRGGKSFILALIAVFLAFFKNWKQYLAPGEYGTILIIAADRSQARTILRYIKGLVENIRIFKPEITRDTQWGVEILKRRIVIEIHTTSFRATRGYTIVAALLDEVAFWRSDESANLDSEVINAIRPGMASVPGAMLLAASSPYSKRGILYDHFKKYFGKTHPDVLIWHGPTRSMNPGISQKFIDKQYERDPARAEAEYGAAFRSDIEDFVTEEAFDAVVDSGVFGRDYFSRHLYRAFCDPSGGSQDSFTLAIGHPEDNMRILDYIEEWRAPFDPDIIVEEIAQVLKRFSIVKVWGDNFAGNWPKEKFRKQGIAYEPCGMRKSDLYRDALPLINSGSMRLLDHKRLKIQSLSLERKLTRGGKFTIDHPPGGKDDVVNSTLGLMTMMHIKTITFSDDQVFIGKGLSVDVPGEFIDAIGEIGEM